jgi:hypothetical protein
MAQITRNRLKCMASIREIVAVDPWFASYALEQLALAVGIDVLNELAEGLEGLLAAPEATGNDRLEVLVRERFGL